MKRIISVFLMLFMICGCSNSDSGVQAVISGITFTAQISFYNEMFTCDGSISGDGVLELTVTEPENISGMMINVENGCITARFKGLTYTPNTGTFPFGGVAQNIWDVFNDASKRLAPVSREGENYFIQSAPDEKYYKITLAETGLPLSLEYPAQGLKVQFLKMTIINK